MIRALLLALLLLPGARAALAANSIEPFYGTYVGRALEGGSEGKQEERDIDLVIRSDERGGLVLSWTNVTLVDGRRDVPGVRRRTDEVHLAPLEGEVYTARTAYDPFSESHSPDVGAGDPLRWAVREGDALLTYSFTILEDGRYELQTYKRTLTKEGIDLAWTRVVDGKTVREMTGHAVRAN